MDLTSILSGPVGAVVGGLGAIGGKVVDYFILKQQGEQQLAQKRLDGEQAVTMAKLQQEGVKIQGAVDALKASYESDAARYGDGILGHIVDFSRGIIRPVITVAGFSLMVWATWAAITGGTDLPVDVRKQTLSEAMFTSSVAVTWWFGSRPSTPSARG